MNALVREVCGSASAPREWRRSLAKQRLVLRSGVVRSSLTGIGTRFGGPLVGEELVGTLSERLARSLQGLDVSSTENAVESAAARRAMSTAGVLPAAPRIAANEGSVATTAERPTNATTEIVSDRAWGNVVTHDGQRRLGETAENASQRRREFVDAVAAERGAQIARAVGLDMHREKTEREIVRSSPLDVALRRYWHALPTRATTDSPSRETGPVAVRKTHEIAATRDATEIQSRVNATVPGPIAPRADLVLPEPSPSFESRGWWSTRVDAIHSRTESFTPAPVRPSAARFDDDVVDESAFADALAEVLHRQARAYGVAIP